jgi:type III pantothenate kinase
MIEGMIARTRAELGEDAPVIVTGGLAPLFTEHADFYDHYDPDLTLNGLHLIYDRITGACRS